MSDWNEKIIKEFRANEGRVGGPFTGSPMILIHHVGARTGTERDEVWPVLVAERPGFGGYQEKTDRIIPVFRLRRTD